MTRDNSQRAATQAANYRRRLRDAEQVIKEQREMLLSIWLRRFLTDPSDFDIHVGVEQVTDQSGRINYLELELRVAELLRRKPHLATHDARAIISPQTQ